MGVSHSQRTQRIGNGVKDIKSSATIRQSLWRAFPPLVSRLSFVLVRVNTYASQALFAVMAIGAVDLNGTRRGREI